MISGILRSKGVMALLVAATMAASASVANAAFSATVVSDAGDTHTLVPTPPTPMLPIDATTTFTGLYGTPTITMPAGAIKIDFAGVSPSFTASASSATYSASEFVDTDGRLSLLLHFDSPVSLVAAINETGTYSTTGSGSVNVLGGGVAIEAISPIPLETEIGGLTFGTTSSTDWAANATISGFVGSYTDYQLTIDNDLFATAPGPSGDVVNSASITKKDVNITITTTGNGRTPEPASLGILAIGGMGLLARRRK